MDVVKTLLLPFVQNRLPPPQAGQRILYLNAVYDSAIAPFLSADTLYIDQPFKPYAVQWAGKAREANPAEEDDSAFDYALVLGSKQQKETHGLISRALAALKPGGVLVIAADNEAGGKRLSKTLQSIGLPCEEDSKHHARVVWAAKPDTPNAYDETSVQKWRTESAAQPVTIGNDTYISQPGIFGWDKIDRGSALLAAHLPEDLSGAGADFGCGYGFLSRYILRGNPHIDTLYIADADRRAVEACHVNMKTATVPVTGLWVDLTQPAPPPGLPPLDWIIMNPPFHEGKKAVSAVGQAFIATARACLKPRGTLYMVANAHLPYEETLAAHFKTVEKRYEGDGFKIYKARRG